ncbi:MAG: endonuclease [Bacteriovoracaceae bacterium]|nr:endonuclease [Bacteriovoracaceae bacterium]
MRWLYLVTLLLVLGWNVQAQTIEEDFIFNGPKNIPDEGAVTLVLGPFTIDKITTAQLEVEIEHTYRGDLVVELITPSGKVIPLHSRSGGGTDNLSLHVTTADLLVELESKNAVGVFKLRIEDKARYDVGEIKNAYFILSGEKSETMSSPVEPATPIDSSCSSMWEKIQERNTITGDNRSLIGLCGDALKSALRNIMSGNKDLGYRGARYLMFTEIDNFNGTVCSVYDESCLNTDDIPKGNIMNCEHTWPQSKGATGIAKSDLHHLYPTESKMNSRRSNFPFCTVSKSISSDQGSTLGFSEFGTKCFEPPTYHKGNVARSMFYFAIRYGKKIDREEEHFLKKWAVLDEVDGAEVNRNSAIESYQGNRNPFVDLPELFYLIKDF